MTVPRAGNGRRESRRGSDKCAGATCPARDSPGVCEAGRKPTVSVRGGEYHRDPRPLSEVDDSGAIKVLPPRIIPMSQDELNEASILLAELLVEYVKLEQRRKERRSGYE